MSTEIQQLQPPQEQQPQQQEQPPEPPPIPVKVPKTFLRYSNKPAKDFFDKFRDEKLCTIPATTRVKKQDAFLAMRPKQGTCLDYRISETDTKLDAGMTKIRIRQVNATYEPLPPKEPEPEAPPPVKKYKRNPFHNKYCHARNPVYEFAEEKYARRMIKEQAFFKARMEERIALIREQKRTKKFYEHDFMLELCGPDWFIELSPMQKQTIDNLKDAILHDLRFGQVTETCHILGRLGILLRPNRQVVDVALNNCCKCPVEFLLTLYQLMNPHRTYYSLNDMLILSSVVHLTLKSTLKEMHLRLPSPPPPLPQKFVKSKRPKQCEYESPYLKPCRFLVPKPTVIQTWTNRHVIFPKSPYFSYLKELYDLRHPTFVARSRLRVSKERVSNAPETATLQNELMAAQAAFNKTHEHYEHENVRLLQASIYHNCDKQTQSTIFTAHDAGQGASGVTKNKTVGEGSNTEDVKTMEQTTVSLSIEVKVTKEFNDENKETAAMYQCQVDTRVEIGPPEQNGSTDSDSIPEVDNAEPVQKTGAVKEEFCNCKNKHSRGTCGARKACLLRKHEAESHKLIEVKERTRSNCTCRQVIEKQIEDSTCQCEKCKEKIEKDNIKTTYVISDTKMDPDGPIPIISDVRAERKCTCLERYLKRVNKIDHKKEVRRAHEHLIDMGQPFIVNGVSIGPDGKPIYNLSSGVAVKIKCPCLRHNSEAPQATKLATIPMGRQKYAISGVHTTPEGNVFVISSAIPVEPCRCMRMYKEYVKQHDPCLQLYEAFLLKIKSDTEEYMEDLRDRNIHEDGETSSSSSTYNSDHQEDQDEPLEGAADVDDIIQAVNKSSDHGSDDHMEDDTYFDLDIEFEKRTAPPSGKRVCICNVIEEKEETFDEKTSDPTQYLTDYEATKIPDQSHYLTDYDATDYERYIILDYIPTDYAAQVDIIKRLLHKLAQDGFPLARLPDCHKLPIFKLWMAKRTYQYWTYEDRLSTLGASKDFWNHVFHCTAYRTKNITLGINNNDANNFTWLDAKMVKDYTTKRRSNYQTKQRQDSVAAAREFFTTLFMYENYSDRFRDVYFAYMPSKEEDVIYHNVWKSYDYRNLLMNRQVAKVYRCSKLI